MSTHSSTALTPKGVRAFTIQRNQSIGLLYRIHCAAFVKDCAAFVKDCAVSHKDCAMRHTYCAVRDGYCAAQRTRPPRSRAMLNFCDFA
jgi:hypothetical protein